MHHNLVYGSDEEWKKWKDAAHTHMPWHNRDKKTMPAPYTREEWDRWIGQFQAVTDVAALFAPHLIETYPKAKVILIIRPFDSWYSSIVDTLAKFSYNWDYPIRRYILDPLCGGHSASGLRACLSGWLEADNLRDAKANARRRYEEHHRLVRAMVPKEQVLEYRLGDGWEPLAKFLGKDVPVCPFPHVNERDMLIRLGKAERRKKLIMAAWNLVKLASPVAWLFLGYWVGASWGWSPSSAFEG